MNSQILTSKENAGKVGTRATLTSGAYFDAKHETTHRPRTTREANTANWNARHVTPSQVRRIPQQAHYEVFLHADMIKVKSSAQKRGVVERSRFSGGQPHEQLSDSFGGVIGINIPRAGLQKRGKIRGFSNAARKRMIEFLAKIRHPGHMIFVTLTYPDIFPTGDKAAWTSDFEKFRHRFQRQYPQWSALWRMELIERKSGYNEGIVAPHYHLIVFTGENLDDTAKAEKTLDFWAWCSNNWFEIANYDCEEHIFYGCDTSSVKSRKHAYAYVSKYVAKACDDGHSVGRRWGRIGKFDTSASQKFVLTDECFVELRRIIKRWLKTRSRVPDENASPEEVEKWLLRMKKDRSYAKRFGGRGSMTGFSVFGLGDTMPNGELFGLTGGGQDFIFAVADYRTERKSRYQSHGD